MRPEWTRNKIRPTRKEVRCGMKQAGKAVFGIFVILGIFVLIASAMETWRLRNDPAAEGSFLGNLGGALIKRTLPLPLA